MEVCFGISSVPDFWSVWHMDDLVAETLTVLVTADPDSGVLTEGLRGYMLCFDCGSVVSSLSTVDML